MKVFRFFTFLVAVLLLAGCNKEKEEVAPDPSQQITSNTAAAGQMIAKINGVAWRSQTAFVGNASPEGLSISGQNNGKMISITIAGVVMAGSFDVFTYESLNGWYMEVGNGTMQTWTSISSHKCKLEITKLDWTAKKMSGTFSFAADSQASSSSAGAFLITDGSFTDLPITAAAPASSTSMTATVNNVQWNGAGMYIFGFPGSYYLTGSDATGQAINIGGFSSLQPGTSNALWADFLVPAANDHQVWRTEQNNPAIITITSYNPITKKASGTFAFTANERNFSGPASTKKIQGTFTDILIF